MKLMIVVLLSVIGLAVCGDIPDIFKDKEGCVCRPKGCNDVSCEHFHCLCVFVSALLECKLMLKLNVFFFCIND